MRKVLKFALAAAMLSCGFTVKTVAKTPFKVVAGDPLALLQKAKRAVYEIDYSGLIVTDTDHPENDMDFTSWMISQDEDNDKWTRDWEEKDKAACDKAFREKWNDEVKDGIRLTKLGKDYKVILRLKKIDFGPPVTYNFRGFHGGEARANGELELCDFETGETVTLISFKDLKGEDSFKQIGRLKGIFENLGENMHDFLKDCKKEAKKRKK